MKDDIFYTNDDGKKINLGRPADMHLALTKSTEFVKSVEERKIVDYVWIQFQDGPRQENGINGCLIEDVINVLLARLEDYQKTKFNCHENDMAITKLTEGRLWLEERTRARVERGVEGKNII